MLTEAAKAAPMDEPASEGNCFTSTLILSKELCCKKGISKEQDELVTHARINNILVQMQNVGNIYSFRTTDLFGLSPHFFCCRHCL